VRADPGSLSGQEEIADAVGDLANMIAGVFVELILTLNRWPSTLSVRNHEPACSATG